eukprot:TRINITY_DN67737_c0_g1_i1.p1 TRINITY_DN67737_c0_g1~~TRINITY_DN67737_c0_g1_i1.p1  ORF type:complete len:190 (+),score=30.59 TRINITY_DN67737_c0_g1_i1:42-572(+)
MSARCEFVAGSSRKFWQIQLRPSDRQTTVTYGKIGGPPKTDLKNFATNGLARKFIEKMLASKVKKGYVHVGKAKNVSSTVKKTIAKAKAMKKAALKTATAMKVQAGGKNLCFTGTLPVKRSVATAAAKAKGFKVTSGVNNTTNILVVGEGAGKKINKGALGMEHWPWAKFKSKVGL